eukprot:GEZU01039249.1.p1 GENE.GEZU01039249.1~~GEZU01039249.1.p1  ORF type:complete len:377 (+),score=62.85 GEZU01039249.1:34-1131(+)
MQPINEDGLNHEANNDLDDLMAAITMEESQINQSLDTSKPKKNTDNRGDVTNNNNNNRNDVASNGAKVSLWKQRKQKQKNKSASYATSSSVSTTDSTDNDQDLFTFKPIGRLESCFVERNGTPRQGLLAPFTRAKLTISGQWSGALEGLEGYTHVWIIFIFHDNTGDPNKVRPKIAPPRLGGKKVGVFATRAPHRPCNIGLSVAKVLRIERNTIFFSGIDILHGTPILDIKPYIPEYDALPDARMPDWMHTEMAPNRTFSVEITDEAMQQFEFFADKLHLYNDWREVVECVKQILALDIRTIHMKAKHKFIEGGAVYGFCIDSLNVVFRVDDENKVCHVTKVEHWPQNYDSSIKPGSSEYRDKHH